MFKWKDDHIAYSGTNVIEVAKDRENGTQDWFIPIWYEKESRRMKNSLAENIIYGWQIDIPKETQSEPEMVDYLEGSEWTALPEEGDGWDDFD